MKQLLLTTTLSLALATGAAMADPVPPPAEPVIARLEAEGYALVETKRSWLGRFVVLSQRDGQLREVVLNRTTGAVLSDRLFRADTSTPSGAGHGADETGARGNGAGKSGDNGAPRN